MNNKNIIFNHTLEQYNKKYRNRTYRLLKFTKKQVEDFDKEYGHYIYNGKTHSLEFKNYLLENRKWWFTKEDECYHEIPRPVRFTWYRNLNCAVQAGCCLLGGGVVAAAVTVPLVLLNQTNGSSITIEGADYDKELSHIELNKESTIKLMKKDKEIYGIEYVKVKEKKLSENQYSFNEKTSVVTIEAEAMTSTKIAIKVINEKPLHKVKLEYIEDERYGNSVKFNGQKTVEIDENTKTISVDCNIVIVTGGRKEYNGFIRLLKNSERERFEPDIISSTVSKTTSSVILTLDVSTIDLKQYETLYIAGIIGTI